MIIPKLTKKIPNPIKKIIYHFLAQNYIKKINTEIDKNKKTILILNHFFDQDIAALLKENKDYNLVVINAPMLFKGARFYFSKGVQDINIPYLSEPENNRFYYNKECQCIFDALNYRFNIKLIVTASDMFYWVREFINVAHDNRVNTVILDKEGLISPSHFKSESERKRKFTPLISDHIYVWSERQVEFWQESGVNKKNITVIGQPRSDNFFRKKTYKVDKMFDVPQPLITFFTYEDTAYIPISLVREENLSWKGMKEETQDHLYQLAKVHPEYNFIFKAHPQQTDLESIQSKYTLPNLRVVGGSDIANELIIRSELIIAFQTTAIIEAMFMEKNVIYTAWDDTINFISEEIIPYHQAQGIVIAKSFDLFKKVCKDFFEGDQSDFNFSTTEIKEKHEMVSQYLYKPDGHVAERFFNEIKKLF